MPPSGARRLARCPARAVQPGAPRTGRWVPAMCRPAPRPIAARPGFRSASRSWPAPAPPALPGQRRRAPAATAPRPRRKARLHLVQRWRRIACCQDLCTQRHRKQRQHAPTDDCRIAHACFGLAGHRRQTGRHADALRGQQGTLLRAPLQRIGRIRHLRIVVDRRLALADQHPPVRVAHATIGQEHTALACSAHCASAPNSASSTWKLKCCRTRCTCRIR